VSGQSCGHVARTKVVLIGELLHSGRHGTHRFGATA
jgi:hypothetical protein